VVREEERGAMTAEEAVTTPPPALGADNDAVVAEWLG
jgi:hypothetical protein